MKVRSYWLIIIASILVPGIVAYFLFGPQKIGEVSQWHYYLPHINAILNSLTASLLLLGLVFIRNNHPQRHRFTMLAAFFLGVLFLISYLTYHASVPSAIFGDANHDGILDIEEQAILGFKRATYLFLLLSHIGLAFVVVPLVLVALFHALTENFEGHLKVVKYAYPVWLYVSVTGVLVYLMIRPYYTA